MNTLNQDIEANQDPSKLFHTSLAHVLGDQAPKQGPGPGDMVTMRDGRIMEYTEAERYETDDNTIYTSRLTGEKITYKEMKERAKRLRESRERGEKEVDGPIEMWV